MFNEIIVIARLGQNAEAKPLRPPVRHPQPRTQESWKNDKGEYETRTGCHRVHAWNTLSKFARTLQKGQFITLEGKLKYTRSRKMSKEFPSSTGSPRSMPLA